MSDRDPIDLTDEPSPAEMEALSRLLADATVWDEPDPGVEDLVVAAIMAEAASAGPRARPEPETGPAPADTPDRSTGGFAGPAPRRPRRAARARSTRGRSGWGLTVGAAAAAALIVVVAVAALRSPADRSGRELALAPSPMAPAASGQALIDERADGTRVLLEVKDLPPAEPGFYYEAWLRKSKEVGVTAGTFHLRGGGAEQIELWSGVSPRDYPLFTVTLQEEGKGAESSGRVVLSGRLG